ncbi:MAG TPA: tetraacyldisaccharide 4'-kinase [Casimicrobiaceae bacterium]|nr:tetraacyldisaccharide 4'-kinase [Casimicrobiaceae bacterium]
MTGRSALASATAVSINADWYSARPSPLAIALRPVSIAFGAAVALRRALYRSGLRRSVTLPVPVVIVGNITVGGSGKTPLVAALVRALAQRGFNPGVVSRGYGRDRGDDAPILVGAHDDPRRVGDEPLLLARAGCIVAVARDRVSAGRALLARHPECDVIVADDGLQHYRLERTVEIAVVDGTRALGNGWLLPAGPLREPAARLDEVDAVVTLVTAGARAKPPRRDAFAMTLSTGEFVRVGSPETTAPASAFFGDEVHAVAGIGDPKRFFAQLNSLGIRAIEHPFPDHHRFTAADIAFAGARAVLMTEKDAVKCEAFAGQRCWYLPVRAEVDDALVALIEKRIRGPEAA